MTVADPFTAATSGWQYASSRGVRDRRCPIVSLSVLPGHLPDPRVAPQPRPLCGAVPDTREVILTRGFMWSVVTVLAGAALLVAGLVCL